MHACMHACMYVCMYDCTILFVHGAGGRAGQFRHQIEHFARKVNVVAFDFLEHCDYYYNFVVILPFLFFDFS